jgi:hypothetical protein
LTSGRRQSCFAPRAAAKLFRPSGDGEDAPQLCALTMLEADLSLEDARALAASGWHLEDLDLDGNCDLTAAGAAALVTAPACALRRLILGRRRCIPGTAFALSLANAPWPLEEPDLEVDGPRAVDGPALAALSRHVHLRHLAGSYCRSREAGFKALAEAVRPTPTFFSARCAKAEFDGACALGAGTFAGFTAPMELDLPGAGLGEAGARQLARRSRRWPRLPSLDLYGTQLNDTAASALALGDWPRLARLDLSDNRLGAPSTLADARRWAPALMRFQAEEAPREEGSDMGSVMSINEWVD